MIPKKINAFYLFFLCMISSAVIAAQQPTHIDPGHGDEGVSILSNPLYLLLIVGLLVLVAVGFYFLRKDNQKRK